MKKLIGKSFLCGCVLVLWLIPARAQSQENAKGHAHGHQPAEGPSRAGPVRLTIPDVEVLDQDGKRQRLYTDLVKGKRVVINFVYTTCTSYCPLSGDNFARLQKLLGDRMGKEVYLLTISTDPETDSPAKLKAWSARFGPRAGWTFVTGETPAMQTLLRALLGEGPRRGVHTPIAYVLDDASGGWKQTFGLEPPAKLMDMLDQLSALAKP